MKKLVAFVLVLALCLSLCSVTAFADGTTVSFTLNDAGAAYVWSGYTDDRATTINGWNSGKDSYIFDKEDGETWTEHFEYVEDYTMADYKFDKNGTTFSLDSDSWPNWLIIVITDGDKFAAGASYAVYFGTNSEGTITLEDTPIETGTFESDPLTIGSILPTDFPKVGENTKYWTTENGNSCYADDDTLIFWSSTAQNAYPKLITTVEQSGNNWKTSDNVFNFNFTNGNLISIVVNFSNEAGSKIDLNGTYTAPIKQPINSVDLSSFIGKGWAGKKLSDVKSVIDNYSTDKMTVATGLGYGFFEKTESGYKDKMSDNDMFESNKTYWINITFEANEGYYFPHDPTSPFSYTGYVPEYYLSHNCDSSGTILAIGFDFSPTTVTEPTSINELTITEVKTGSKASDFKINIKSGNFTVVKSHVMDMSATILDNDYTLVEGTKYGVAAVLKADSGYAFKSKLGKDAYESDFTVKGVPEGYTLSLGVGKTYDETTNRFTLANSDGEAVYANVVLIFTVPEGGFKPEPSINCEELAKGAAIAAGITVVTVGTIHTVKAIKNYKAEKAAAAEAAKLAEMPMVAIGDSGEAVTTLQTELNAQGYNCGEVDGIFGQNTLNAVIAFQTANGLDADGVVGELTWGALL